MIPDTKVGNNSYITCLFLPRRADVLDIGIHQHWHVGKMKKISACLSYYVIRRLSLTNAYVYTCYMK